MSDAKKTSARRQPGPRALVLAVLRDVTRRSKDMVKVWNEHQTVYTREGVTDPTVSGTWRKRRRDEQIENQVSSWTMLARFARQIAAEMDKLAEYADSRRADLQANPVVREEVTK